MIVLAPPPPTSWLWAGCSHLGRASPAHLLPLAQGWGRPPQAPGTGGAAQEGPWALTWSVQAAPSPTWGRSLRAPVLGPFDSSSFPSESCSQAPLGLSPGASAGKVEALRCHLLSVLPPPPLPSVSLWLCQELPESRSKSDGRGAGVLSPLTGGRPAQWMVAWDFLELRG